MPAPRAHLHGLLSIAAALGVGELVAAVGRWRSPVVAVADAVVDRSPESVVRRAIDILGTADKAVLLVGTVVVLLAAAPAVFARGVAGRARLALGITAAVTLLGAWLATVGRQGTGPSAVPAVCAGAVFAAFVAMAGRRRGGSEEDTDHAERMPVTILNRRQVIAGGALAIGGGVGGRLLASARSEVDRSIISLPAPIRRTGAAPDAPPPLAGVSSYITPNRSFYRIDTALFVPQVDHRNWKLRIGGAVRRPVTLTYDDLLRRPHVEHVATMLCVSNEIGGDLVGTASWQGVPLRDVLEEVGVEPGGTQVFSTSVDGWTCGFPTELAMDGREAMIALGMNGEPLPVRHGFPARLIVPGLYGYVSHTKWLSDIDLVDLATVNGYWIPRGWSKDGPVRPGSRIDTPRSGTRVAAGRVGVGGVAWCNHRGVDAVQVRVDDGGWNEATVHAGVNDDSWRQWTWAWDAPRGRHTLAVRMRTNDGEWQTGEIRPVAPDGATGWHTVRVSVQ
jgi:DMSO/TMAO reductase YedYZ molybdopterin-dependent catalytic subunit